jgi:hybrid polyketide synthase / nonribosomal peptide synthetase FtdB
MKNTSIAIVGLSCRFPLANNPNEFWKNLCAGRDCIRGVPEERSDIRNFYTKYPKLFSDEGILNGGFLDKFQEFDPTAFKISPLETMSMDPQQRLLLEVTWEALEDAGQQINELSGTNTGVFVGISTTDFGFRWNQHFANIDSYTNTGMALSLAANRISYIFNFKGPSLSIDTACSSSLAAVYYACQSLISGNSSLALAGGVNLILSPLISYGMKKAGVLSPVGKCNTFDASANGYVRGEGAGMIVLKTLSAAIEANDAIYAVIEGGAINQNGKGNGLTAPNGLAQSRLIEQALDNAGIASETVDYVEAHGTGTFLGDLIEANALGKVIGKGRKSSRFCRIGSVKSNIGHLEAAAGIAGIIKVALSIKNKILPPSINFNKPNPQIDFPKIGLKVQQKLSLWEKPEKLTAGISSFGFGGTNVHLLLTSAPNQNKTVAVQANYLEKKQKVLAVSAHSQNHLRLLVCNYIKALDSIRNNPKMSDDFCADAALRRSHREFRTLFIFENFEDLEKTSKAFLENQSHPKLISGKTRLDKDLKIAFIFSGFGGQWKNMGQKLFENEPVFADSLNKISQLAEKFGFASIVEKITTPIDDEQINSAEHGQPVIFAIQAALSDLLQHYGIRPDFVSGHSFGEVAAAYSAGILSLENAVKIIVIRSRQLGKIRLHGKMAIVEKNSLNIIEILKEFNGKVSLAAQNSPFQTIVSGDKIALEQLLADMEKDNIFCKFVNSDVAGHSYQINPLLNDFRQTLVDIEHHCAKIRYFSGFTGNEIPEKEKASDYWADNLRKPVLFADTIKNLAAEGCEVFIEIGPHPVLLTSIEQTLNHFNYKAKTLPSLKKEKDCHLSLWRLLSELFVLGKSFDWSKIYSLSSEKTGLPSYTWVKENYYPAEDAFSTTYLAEETASFTNSIKDKFPLLGKKIEVSILDDKTEIYEKDVSIAEFPFLNDHCLGDRVVFPGAVFVEIMQNVAKSAFGNTDYSIEDIEFFEALFLDQNRTYKFQTVFQRKGALFGEVKILAFLDEQSSPIKWTLIAAGNIILSSEIRSTSQNLNLGIELIKLQIPTKEKFYTYLSKNNLNYGRAFKGVNRLLHFEDGFLGEFSIPEPISAESENYCIHPATLDSCFHLLGGKRFLDKTITDGRKVFLPAKIKKLHIGHIPSDKFYGFGLNFTESNADFELISSDIKLFDHLGNQIGEIIGIECRNTYFQKLLHKNKPKFIQNCFYRVDWQPVQLDADDSKRVVWLILSDGGELCRKVVSQIQQRNEKYIITGSEKQTGQIEKQSKKLDFRSEQDFREIFAKTAALDKNAEIKVLNLLPLELKEPDEIEKIYSLAVQQVYQNQLLTSHLINLESNRKTEIWICTKGGQKLPGEKEVPSPVQASLWGLGRSLQNEAFHIWGGLIDLSTDFLAKDVESIISSVMNIGVEKQIALRGTECFVARLSHDTVKKVTKHKLNFAGNSYLITGGLGGLGLSVAEWLAQNGASKIILTGKNKFPQRKDWDKQVENSTVAKKIEKILNIEQLGAIIEIHCFDIANFVSLKNFYNSIPTLELNKIKGIIHAAGVLQDCTVINSNLGSLEKVFNAKVKGFLHLKSIFNTKNLQFLTLFSSSAAILGSAGQSGYAAANAFLDSFTTNENGNTVQSINWGPWAEIGLAHLSIKENQTTFQGIQNLIPTVAVEQFGEILQRKLLNTSVLDIDWRKLEDANPLIRQNVFFKEVLIESGTVPKNRLSQNVNLSNGYLGVFDKNKYEQLSTDKQIQLLFGLVQEIIGKLLMISSEKIAKDSTLESLGFDSLTSMQFKNSVQNQFKVSLSIKYLLQSPTVEELTENLQILLGKEAKVLNKEPSLSENIGRELNIVEHEIVKIAAELLGKQEAELGNSLIFEKKSAGYCLIPEFDALLSNNFLTRLRRLFKIEISINDLIENSTLDQLSLLILKYQLQNLGLNDIDGLISEIKKLRAGELEQTLNTK